MKIAFVEDDKDALEIFSKRLRDDGHVCHTYGAGEELLKAIQPGSYDVLVSDIRLPGISGIELLERLRRRQFLLPCILITGFSNLEYARAALNANANYLIEKPFKYESLLQAIKKVTSSGLSVEYCVEKGLADLSLTGREKEVARLILKGLGNQEIAKHAGLSEKTVKQYVTQIFQKSRVSSRSEFFSSIFPV